MQEDTFRWVVAGAVALATLCILVQAIVMIALFSTMKKMQARVNLLIDRTEPLLESVKTLVNDLSPRIKQIAQESAETVKLAREQVERIRDLVKDVADRTKVQVARIDGAVDETMEQVQHAGTAVKGAVMRPLREVTGIVSGLRAAVGVYTQGRRASVDHATQDEEMFI